MWSPTHSESKPRASAARAIAASSGQRTSRSTSGNCTPTSKSADDAGDAEPGVDVLALDLAVLDREDVDAVPLELLAVARRGRRPLVDYEAVADVEAAAAERDVRRVAEDLRDVLARRLALRALAGAVVVEDEVRRVHRNDLVHVVAVPRVVVALDQLPFIHR